MSLLLALLAQIGPHASGGAQPVSPLPPEILEREEQERRRTQGASSPPPASATSAVRTAPVSQQLADCLEEVRSGPSTATEAAATWLEATEGAARAEAGHCLGVGLSRQDRWDEAAAAFLAARDAAAPENRAYRARLGAMAGNAALAHGDTASALAALDAARTDAQAESMVELQGQLAIDRARALVMLDRGPEAEAALAEARQAIPSNPQAWLLSATLARRLGNLAQAQARIEKAGELAPTDPEVGLEAGVIAVLSGREESARKSWQSVIDAVPESAAAKTARDYLAQLGSPETAAP